MNELHFGVTDEYIYYINYRNTPSLRYFRPLNLSSNFIHSCVVGFGPNFIIEENKLRSRTIPSIIQKISRCKVFYYNKQILKRIQFCQYRSEIDIQILWINLLALAFGKRSL